MEEDGKALDGVGKRVIRSIRKKLQATQKWAYVVSTPAQLEEGANRRLILSTPYHKDFVEALKETIPSAYRRWEDKTNCNSTTQTTALRNYKLQSGLEIPPTTSAFRPLLLYILGVPRKRGGEW
ncbi:MAG: hypothetical protein WCS37_00010 [Chloroflexota bacterium]|nr:hypothetical protein [Chloroflexota bacterium]